MKEILPTVEIERIITPSTADHPPLTYKLAEWDLDPDKIIQDLDPDNEDHSGSGGCTIAMI